MNFLKTKINKTKHEGDPRYILAGNGHYFRKDKKGFLPTILEEMYAERDGIKSNMMVHKQELVNVKEELKKRGLQ